MVKRASSGSTSTRRCLFAGIVFAAATVLVCLADTPRAEAQGFFDNLFGGGQPRSQPAYPGYGPDTYYAAPRRRKPRHKASAPPPDRAPREAAKDKPPQKNASVFVYVFGDSLGQLLADGLDDSLSDRQDVAVVHKAKGSTGLVMTAFYDWPGTISALLDDGSVRKAEKSKDENPKPKEQASQADGIKDTNKADSAKKPTPPKIDVAVMMIGINDRQSIVEGGKKYDAGSPEWTSIYKKRVTAIEESFAKRGIPLIWVGVPITKDDNFADDMAAFNDIYREAAGKSGAVYVDTWEAFSDDKGAFSAYGPDINGQTVRLRSNDGILFTKAGARKLAHFVETHVRRALDGKVPPPQLPTAEAPAEGDANKTRSAPVAAVKPDAGPIRDLNEIPAAQNGELASVTGFKSEKVPERSDVAVDASAPRMPAKAPAPIGRADDLRWPSGSEASSPPAR